MEGFEEELLVGCVPGTESGVEFPVTKLPVDDQESVLFDEFPGHTVGFAAVHQAARGMNTGAAPDRSNSTPSAWMLSSAFVRIPRPCTAIRSSQSPAVVVATYWPSATTVAGVSCSGTPEAFDVGLSPQPVPPSQPDHRQDDDDQRHRDEHGQCLVVH